MKAIILSAGQGRRLLPFTEGLPKCLLPLNQEHTLLSWQLAGLARVGVAEAVVVTGFETGKVERELDRQPHLLARALYNPFYDVADNLGSVWCALPEMAGDVILLNGDTLFVPAVAARLLQSQAGLTMTISRKGAYDDDDMKVALVDGRVTRVGKRLDPDETQAEAIGMTLLRGAGTAVFAEAVARRMRQPDARRIWYPAVLDDLARERGLATSEAGPEDWCEVDEPADLEHARAAVRQWCRAPGASQVAAAS